MKKRNIKFNRKARKKIRARVTILFISIIIFTTAIVTVFQKSFSIQNDVNAAVAAQNEAESSTKSDKVESNITEEENKGTEEKKSAESDSVEKDQAVDDVADVEKFLSQESQGINVANVDGRKIVYLTFDDGPSETVTPKVLDVLKAENVKATFFVVGEAIDKTNGAKEILKRANAEGHAIGNHTYSHNYKYLYPNRIVNVDNFMADIEKTNKSIRNVLGEDFPIRAIRFPGGHMSWKGVKSIDNVLATKDYHQIDWNALSKDAEGKPKVAEELLNEVIQSVQGKDKTIILMHDTYGKKETAKALPQIIKYLKEQGYEFKIMK